MFHWLSRSTPTLPVIGYNHPSSPVISWMLDVPETLAVIQKDAVMYNGCECCVSFGCRPQQGFIYKIDKSCSHNGGINESYIKMNTKAHPRAPKLHCWIGEMFIMFSLVIPKMLTRMVLCSLRILSFIPVILHLSSDSSRLCAMLSTLTLSFQTYYIQTQTAVTAIALRLDKAQCLC